MEYTELMRFEQGLTGLVDSLSKRSRVSVFRSFARVIGAELSYTWDYAEDKKGKHFEIFERAVWPESKRFEKERILGIYLEKGKIFSGHYPGLLYGGAFSGVIDPTMRRLAEKFGGSYISYLDIGRRQIKLPSLKLLPRIESA